MTGRLLVWFALAVALYLYIRRRFRILTAAAGRTRQEPEATSGPRIGGVMVRDRMCDTYLPRERALLHRGEDGSEHFFCSETCRRSFLESPRG